MNPPDGDAKQRMKSPEAARRREVWPPTSAEASESRNGAQVQPGVHLGPILGLSTPADSGIDVGQERQIVRSTRELCVFLP